MYTINRVGNQFHLVEDESQNLINVFDSRSLAQKFRRRYQGGQGFNGWTPAFILNKYKQGYGDNNEDQSGYKS